MSRHTVEARKGAGYKLEAGQNGGQLIKTIRGAGYMLACDVQSRQGQPA